MIAKIIATSFILFLSAIPNTQAAVLKVHFVDVGYGDAIVLELPNKQTVLIDAGDRASGRRLIKYLQGLSSRTIDTFILTHPDPNHYEGFEQVLENFSVVRIYHTGQDRSDLESYQRFLSISSERKIPVSIIKEGMSLTWGNVQIQALHPDNISEGTNESSLVLWLTHNKASFLLTADIQPAQQDKIIRTTPRLQEVSAVQVPHHGGLLSDEFTDFFRDKILIVSTGKNIYDKPFLDELGKLKGWVLRTDLLGAIVLESNGETVTITTGIH